MKRVMKPLLALVAALGLLTLLAAPSAASTGAITGGTLTVAGGTGNFSPLTSTLGGTGTCAPATITALDSSTGTTGSTTVTGSISLGITQAAFVYSGTNYVFAATSTGTYTSTHNTDSTYNVTVHMNLSGGTIKQASATDTCVSTGTAKCTAISATSFTLTGTASLTAVHPGPVGTVTLGGSRAVTAFGCTAPFSALNTAIATVTGLTATLT